MTPTERLDKFNMHHKKIAEIIVGCIGVESRQVHWREVAPMIAAYVNSEHDKARNQAIQDCIDIVSVTPGDENVIPKLEKIKAGTGQSVQNKL